MKKLLLSGWKSLILSLAASAVLSFPASAASIHGEITDVNFQKITGWAWNKEDTNDVQTVEVHILQAGNPDPVKYLKATADDFSQELEDEIQDGWHMFSVKIDWSQLEGNDFKVRAYAVKDDKYYTLGDTISYSKGSGASSAPAETTAAASGTSSQSAAASSTSAQSTSAVSSGSLKSLGIFTTSGYCGCEQCSKGYGLTYSGTVPQANHTISADLSLLPIGTRVQIGGVIYTVEDKGSSVNGNEIDIFYSDHNAAQAHGLQQQEVFLVQ